jgi:FkbM family methyltransferase
MELANFKLPADGGTQYVYREIFERQCYAPVLGLPEPRSILDIGAHVGIAAAFFRLACPNSPIFCVEPDPRSYAMLEYNAAHIGNCRAFNVGLSDVSGSQRLNVSRSSVLSSFLENPWSEAVSTPVDIDVRAAGDFARELHSDFDTIKVDTEGSEIPILQSLGSITAAAHTIHIEFHSHADRR